MKQLKLKVFVDTDTLIGIFDVLEYSPYQNTVMIEVEDDHDGDTEYQTIYLDYCKILQYIGINDKHGNELYEGDIVQETLFDRRFEIQYCFDYKKPGDRNHFARFELKDLKTGDISPFNDFIFPENSLEKIGNIYTERKE